MSHFVRTLALNLSHSLNAYCVKWYYSYLVGIDAIFKPGAFVHIPSVCVCVCVCVCVRASVRVCVCSEDSGETARLRRLVSHIM